MNNKKRLILIGASLLIILAIIGSIIYKKRPTETLPDLTETETVFTSPSTRIVSDEQKKVAHEAWLAFESYIGYAKKHDIEGISKLTYKLSPTCSDSTKVAECNSIMDSLVALGKLFDENMFTHIVYDDKQIILSSDFKMEENEAIRGYSHAVIYFIRDNGTLKIVGLGPTQGRYLAKKPSGQTDAELNSEIAYRLKDSDSDGVADFVESCIEPSKDEVCVKTDPNNKDTNKNGYWDGIDIFLTK